MNLSKLENFFYTWHCVYRQEAECSKRNEGQYTKTTQCDSSTQCPSLSWLELMFKELLDRMLPFLHVNITTTRMSVKERALYTQRMQALPLKEIFMELHATVQHVLTQVSSVVCTRYLSMECCEDPVQAMNKEELNYIQPSCTLSFQLSAREEDSVTSTDSQTTSQPVTALRPLNVIVHLEDSDYNTRTVHRVFVSRHMCVWLTIKFIQACQHTLPQLNIHCDYGLAVLPDHEKMKQEQAYNTFTYNVHDSMLAPASTTSSQEQNILQSAQRYVEKIVEQQCKECVSDSSTDCKLQLICTPFIFHPEQSQLYISFFTELPLHNSKTDTGTPFQTVPNWHAHCCTMSLAAIKASYNALSVTPNTTDTATAVTTTTTTTTTSSMVVAQ